MTDHLRPAVHRAAAHDGPVLDLREISGRRGSSVSTASRAGDPFLADTEYSPTSALLERARARPDTDRTLGVPVVAVGLIEAVAVYDGQFTPVLRCADLPGTITLEFTEKMRKQALDNLCRWVAVEGGLYSVEANRYRLEVHRLRAARRIEKGNRDRWQ
jgi:hypothetical protein